MTQVTAQNRQNLVRFVLKSILIFERYKFLGAIFVPVTFMPNYHFSKARSQSENLNRSTGQLSNNSQYIFKKRLTFNLTFTCRS